MQCFITAHVYHTSSVNNSNSNSSLNSSDKGSSDSSSNSQQRMLAWWGRSGALFGPEVRAANND